MTSWSLISTPCGPGGLGVQLLKVPHECVEGLDTLPKVVLCDYGDLTALCRFTLQPVKAAAFASVNLAVTRLRPQAQGDGLAVMAEHWRTLRERSSGQSTFSLLSESTRSVKVKLTKSLEVTVVTSEVGAELSSGEVAEALSTFLVCNDCMLDLKDTPLGRVLGVDCIFVHKVSDVGQHTAARVDRVASKVKVTRQVCLERLKRLRTKIAPMMAAIAEEKATLMRVLTKKAVLGLKGVLLCGPSGCGKTTLLEEVKKSVSFFLDKLAFADLFRWRLPSSPSKVRRFSLVRGGGHRGGRATALQEDGGAFERRKRHSGPGRYW